MNLNQLQQAHGPAVIALRRHFHQHPELSNQELRTSARVCEELEKMGIPYERLDKHCVCGWLVGGKAGAGSKRIAIRADMDALPIMEQTGLAFESQNPGVMHACGHDGHTAMALGAAMMLKDMQAELAGTVFFCFQSAEEVGGSAQVLIDYLHARGGVDQVIAAHVWADLDSGLMSAVEGARMANGDFFEVVVKGRGGHGARPDLCVDPIQPLCQIALQLSAIPTNRVSTLNPCVVHIGQIQGGTLPNIFPNTASLRGGHRTFSTRDRERVTELIRDISTHTAAAYGATAHVTTKPGVPMVYNSKEAVDLARQVLTDTGLFTQDDFEPILASEDFGMYLEAFSGFMCFIGIRNEEKGLVYTQHHPRFDIDEQVLPKGAAFFTAYVKAFLAQDS